MPSHTPEKFRIAVTLSFAGVILICWMAAGGSPAVSIETTAEVPSPVDLLLLDDAQRAIVINQGSDTISLVDLTAGTVLHEIPCGRRPEAVQAIDPKTFLVSCRYGGELFRVIRRGDRLEIRDQLQLDFEPWGIAISPDQKRAYVALAAADRVAVVDLEHWQKQSDFPVGRWPRYLALSPDGSRLAVGVNGAGGVAVVDTAAQKVLFTETFQGLNLGHMVPSADGQFVYFPWMVYRNNPITAQNIQLGWVLASRIARVRLTEKVRREAISLDPRGEAVADPHGLAITPDEQTLVCTSAGTQELLVYRLPDLPWQDYGGPGDHIDPELLADPARFSRIPLGGRPLAVRLNSDGSRAYVANYLLSAIQEVDLDSGVLVRNIPLAEVAQPSLVRRGEAIFYDATRSLDQWYSCHSCHYEGGTNMTTMDTRNDGVFRGTFKTVKPLFNIAETGPWTWHGWQTDLHAAMKKSVEETMLSEQPITDDDVRALVAYLTQLEAPPQRIPREYRSVEAQRGEALFHGKAGCANCHSGPHLTDGQLHDLGFRSPLYQYTELNTPSLSGVGHRVRLLHDGRAYSLHEVLTGDHAPAETAGVTLSETELQDLIAYLETL